MANANFIKIASEISTWKTTTVTPWDEKGRTDIVQIFIWHDKNGIAGIQFQYMENGRLVLSACHGATTGNNFTVVKLSYPSEHITCITGVPNPCSEGVYSLTIHTNSGEFGPFGGVNCGLNELCVFQVSNQFGGFYGTANSSGLVSIGVYLKSIATIEPVSQAG